MATDLKKMVEGWRSTHWGAAFPFQDLFAAMAAEIKANREEIERLKVKTKYMRQKKRVMTVEDVLKEVKEIRSIAGDDDEAAHSAEDALWCSVLKAIAKGEQDPRQLATAALLTRRIEFARWCA